MYMYMKDITNKCCNNNPPKQENKQNLVMIIMMTNSCVTICTLMHKIIQFITAARKYRNHLHMYYSVFTHNDNKIFNEVKLKKSKWK